MAFATKDDVATRLGRELTDDEQVTAAAVIATVEGLIVEVSGLAPPDPVPVYYKALCVEKAIGVLANPQNVASQSEQLGDYQHSETFPRALDDGVFLTDREEMTVRRIANGIVSGSSRARALPHDVFVIEDA